MAQFAVSRLMQFNDSTSGLIQMNYDILNRLTQELTSQGAVSYSYDAIGRRTSMTADGLSPVAYQYDAASRLTQVAQGPRAVNLGYDAAGRRTSLGYPNGTATNYSYDNASRLSEILHQGPSGIIEDLLYTYDGAGDRISLNRTNPQADLPAAVTLAYNAANQMTHFNTDTLTYDANGNLTFDGTTTYVWDARNRLVQMSNTNLLASFAYDALGRRVSKTINGVTTQYLYDGNDIMVEIQYGAISATYLRSLNIDEPFLRSSAVAEYYHTDALGSTLALTDQNGATQTTYNYDPFGNTTVASISANPFQYTGRENDGTGLYYYRARYYSPTLIRFISEDPLRATTNLNAYVGNRPTLAIDPFGLYTVVVRGGFGDAPVGSSGSGDSMQTIVNDLQGAGEQATVYGPGNAAAALADLQAHQGDPTGANVVCHSRGCDQILNQLNQNGNVHVDRMVTLDCYGLSGTCGMIPDNVGQNLNYWQDGFLGGGENRGTNGSGAGISNIQLNDTHFHIPQRDDVRRGIVACVVSGQCGGGGMGGRK